MTNKSGGRGGPSGAEMDTRSDRIDRDRRKSKAPPDDRGKSADRHARYSKQKKGRGIPKELNEEEKNQGNWRKTNGAIPEEQKPAKPLLS